MLVAARVKLMLHDTCCCYKDGKIAKSVNFQETVRKELRTGRFLDNHIFPLGYQDKTCPPGTRPQGAALVLVLILMTLAVALITTTTLFLANMLRLDIVRINQTKALAAAAAGVFAAVVDYENNGSITEVTDVSLGDNIYYSIGGAGMFFLADCSRPRIIANRKIKDITMTNLNSTDAVTITHMQVSWTPDGGEKLIAIDLGRGSVEWSGTAPSGTNVDMADYTIGPGVTENDVWLDWETGSDITSMTITAVLTFTDGSTVEITLLNAGAGGDNAVVITSTGKAVSNGTWKRTIKTGYDVGTSEIISWQESSDHL